MGATNFSNKVAGKYDNVHEAFRTAVKQAEYDYGDDGYTGSIAEKDSVRLISDAPRYGTKAFEKFEEKMLDKSEKYDPAFAVEIKGAKLDKIKASRGLKGKRGIKAYYFFGWAAC